MSSFRITEHDNIEDKIMIYGCSSKEMSKILDTFYESLPDIVQDKKNFLISLMESFYKNFTNKEQLEDYVKFILEVVNLTNSSFEEIKNYLLNTAEDIKIANIKCSLIKKSAVITFSNSAKIVFKADPLKNNEIFNNIIKWSNSKVSADHHLNIRKMISRDTHSFIDYMQTFEYKDEKDLANYFLHSGQLLALLYILNCKDYKNISIIPQPRYPALKDVDDIFVSMNKKLNFNISSKSIAHDIIESSVYKIGFLPGRLEPLAKTYVNSIKYGFVQHYNLVINNKMEFIDLLRFLLNSCSSCLAIITTRVYGLNEGDLKRQLYFLDVRFPKKQIIKTPISFSEDGSFNKIEKHRLLSLSARLGDHIIQKSIIGFNGSTISRNWITTVKADKKIALSPGCYDLYEGNSGIALFLLYLGAVTKKDYFINTAMEAMGESITFIRNLNKNNSIEIGAFRGISGELYTLSKIYSITKDKAIKEIVKEGLLLIQTFIEKQVNTSLFNGTSGILAVLISIYENKDFSDIKNKVIATANMVYKRISSQVSCENTNFGFGYGNDGVIAVLARFMAITGNFAIENTIKELLKKERDFNTCEMIFEKPSWQSGWPGILLSRIILKECGYNDELIDTEIYKALDYTIINGFGNSPYYYNGDMGNLEILEYAAEVLNNAELKNRCTNTFSELFAEVIEPYINHEKDYGNKPLSLMKGISGCGYMLLRKCSSIVPQILWLQ
ncbi:lanthionine synthetase LanC family protein [Pseudobacteroides cellulosolvens]|uniref:Lanthionine synthetase C family protein n=1 Tax=Pseudobacteroides cellulosolvens ATCC 35603 = DSM 2933 TaxID=398512 RepID=A0A0L6JTB7_9FIRM|nr:lanthionine synthetase LanC family protein [Pseudobacteroides cellulosolvens]KNY28925.1 Lanthionine synthetase C family protein [Pseudobacteroides cellulosolvens ATCC 35603 = DSM 2933]